MTSTTYSVTDTYNKQFAAMSVFEDIHSAYKILSALDLTNYELEFTLNKLVNKKKQQAMASLIDVIEPSKLIGRNMTCTNALKEYYNAVIDTCNQILNNNYIKSVVYH
jgi:hypothetical protein